MSPELQELVDRFGEDLLLAVLEDVNGDHGPRTEEVLQALWEAGAIQQAPMVVGRDQ